DVVQGGHPAAGDHRRVGPAADVAEQVEVGAGQHAVGGDVGDHVPGAAGLVQPVQRLVPVAALTGPAAGGQPGAADVQADRDPVAVGGDDLGAPVRALECRGADVDPGTAGAQGALQTGVVPDAAGQFDLELGVVLAQAGDHVGDQSRIVA